MTNTIDFYLRLATPDDAPAIAAIRERTLREVVAPLGQYSPDELRGWIANYDSQRVLAFMKLGNFWVAERDGRIVGYGRFELSSPGRALIRGLFVDANFVGRGVGSEILRHLLNEAETLGVTEFELISTLNACSFYERHGFSVVEQVRHATPGGAVIPAIRMRRHGAASESHS